VKVCVTGAILSKKEAMQRSSLHLGAYDALYRVATKHGTLFQNMNWLPVEYNKIYPRHKQSNEIEKTLWLKHAQKDNQWRKTRMAKVEVV
jgi:hypothetical protein